MFKPKSIELVNITTHEHTKYEFRQGLPTLIIGKNEDDPSQKGNGSGKSGFMEGTAIAITGSPVRDASNREMVRRGCEYGEVTLELYNTMYPCELKIYRKLYAGTKSAEVQVWENGEQVVVSDVKEYNKLIFEYLAISKEDFFNFYLLTHATYTPFFSVGDTKKKEVVNRFSGANKVDGTKEFVDIEIEEKKAVVNSVQKLIDVNSGKQELIAKQIEDEEQKFSAVGKAEAIAEIEETINTLLDEGEAAVAEVSTLENEILLKKRFINEQQLELNKHNAELSKKDEEDLKLSKQIEAHEGELSALEEKYEEPKRNAKSLRTTLQDEVAILRENINEAESIKAEIEKQLHGTIECPKCHHKFFIGGQEMTWEEASASLAETKDLLNDLNEDLTKKLAQIDVHLKAEATLDSALEESQVQCRAIIKTIRQQQDELMTDVRRIKLASKEVHNQIDLAERSIATLEKKIIANQAISDKNATQTEELMKQIEEIEKGSSTESKKLEEMLMTILDEGNDLQDRLQEAMNNMKAVEEWNTNFKNFKSFLANQSLKTIEDYTNMYLQKMGTNLSIRIEGYRLMSNKKLKEEIKIDVIRDGIDVSSYGTFSGGERARIDIAVILAIQSLINLNASSGGIDLLFIDEVMDSVDTLGMQYIIEGLKNVGRTVLIVSQVEINSLQEDTLIIRKENKISRIV